MCNWKVAGATNATCGVDSVSAALSSPVYIPLLKGGKGGGGKKHKLLSRVVIERTRARAEGSIQGHDVLLGMFSNDTCGVDSISAALSSPVYIPLLRGGGGGGGSTNSFPGW